MPPTSPRLLLQATCRCTCGAANSSIPSASARQASTSSRTAPLHRLKPPQRWILPDFASRKRAANLPPPRAQKFENKITLPDGSSSSIYTTSSRSNIAITKDTSNHPLWAFPSATGTSGPVEDEGGRMGRFARRFANNQQQQQQQQTSEDSNVQQSSAAPSTEAKDGKKATPTKPTKADATAAAKKEDTKTTATKAEEPINDESDFFDLSLEGEEAEVTGHKVVEESSKKGKKGGGKKK